MGKTQTVVYGSEIPVGVTKEVIESEGVQIDVLGPGVIEYLLGKWVYVVDNVEEYPGHFDVIISNRRAKLKDFEAGNVRAPTEDPDARRTPNVAPVKPGGGIRRLNL